MPTRTRRRRKATPPTPPPTDEVTFGLGTITELGMLAGELVVEANRVATALRDAIIDSETDRLETVRTIADAIDNACADWAALIDAWCEYGRPLVVDGQLAPLGWPLPPSVAALPAPPAPPEPVSPDEALTDAFTAVMPPVPPNTVEIDAIASEEVEGG